MNPKKLPCSKHSEHEAGFVCEICGKPKCFECYSPKKSHKELSSCVDCRKRQNVEEEAAFGFVAFACASVILLYITGLDFWKDWLQTVYRSAALFWNAFVRSFF